MNVAILAVSSLSLVCSAGTLLVMLQVRQDLLTAKSEVEKEIDTVKTKVNHNAKVVKAALSAIEL